MSKFRLGDIVRLKTGSAPQIVVRYKSGRLFALYLNTDAFNNMDDLKSRFRYCGNESLLELSSMVELKYTTKIRPESDFVFHEVYDDSESVADCNVFETLCQSFGLEEITVRYGGQKYTHKSTVNHVLRKLDDAIEKGTTMTKIGTLYKTVDGDTYGTYLATNSQGHYVLEMRDGKGTVKSYEKSAIEEVVPYTFSVKWQGASSDVHYLGEKGKVAVDDLFLCKTHLKYGRVNHVDTKVRECNKVLKAYRMTGLEDFESVESK